MTYRAAYWTAADGQASVILTTPEMRHDCDRALMAAALEEIERTGLERHDGDSITIGIVRV